MTPLEELDIVLDRLMLKKDQYYRSMDLRLATPEIKIEDSRFTSILEKMYSEGIVDRMEYRYKITFDGTVFHEQGGYKGEDARENAQNNRLARVEASATANRRATFVLTLIIAFGTLVAAVYYAIEVLKYLHWIRD